MNKIWMGQSSLINYFSVHKTFPYDIIYNCFKFFIFVYIILKRNSNMGNNPSAANSPNMKNFPMQKYINQGMSQQEVIKIKEAFDAF